MPTVDNVICETITITIPQLEERCIKYVMFSEMFEWVNLKKQRFDEDVPSYGSTQENKPNGKSQDGYSTTEKLLSINTTGDCACGFVHVMPAGKFAISSRYLFKPKETINLKYTASLMSYYLHDMCGYCRGNGISKERFMGEIVPYYVNS